MLMVVMTRTIIRSSFRHDLLTKQVQILRLRHVWLFSFLKYNGDLLARFEMMRHKVRDEGVLVEIIVTISFNWEEMSAS